MKADVLKQRLQELVDAGREIQANVGDRDYFRAAQTEADKLVAQLMKDLTEGKR